MALTFSKLHCLPLFRDSYLWRVWVCSVFFLFHIFVVVFLLSADIYIYIYIFIIRMLHEQDMHHDWRAKINTKLSGHLYRRGVFAMESHTHTHFSRSLVARFDYGYVLARISHHSWCIMQKPRSSIIIRMDIHSVDKFDSLDFRHNAWIWFDFVHQPPVVHPYRDNKRKQ